MNFSTGRRKRSRLVQHPWCRPFALTCAAAVFFHVLWQHQTRIRPRTVCTLSTHFTFSCKVGFHQSFEKLLRWTGLWCLIYWTIMACKWTDVEVFAFSNELKWKLITPSPSPRTFALRHLSPHCVCNPGPRCLFRGHPFQCCSPKQQQQQVVCFNLTRDGYNTYFFFPPRFLPKVCWRPWEALHNFLSSFLIPTLNLRWTLRCVALRCPVQQSVCVGG